MRTLPETYFRVIISDGLEREVPLELTFGNLQFSLSAFAIIALAFSLFILPRLFSFSRRKKKNDSLGRLEVEYRLGEEHEFKSDKHVVAVVDIRGPILTSASGFTPVASRLGTFGVEMGQLIRELGENDSVDGILVRFSTPGGTVTGSEELCDGIVSATARKPVVAYVQDLSASGGVLSMVGASRIVAHQSAMIGSVGVLGPTIKRYQDVTSLGSGLFGEQVTGKVSARVMYAGAGKAFGHPFAEEDIESERHFASILERTYLSFIQHVCGHRRTDPARLQALGARIVHADDALDLELIDEMGNEQKALLALYRLIGMRASAGVPHYSTDDFELVHVKLRTGGRSLPFFELTSEMHALNERAHFQSEVTHALRAEPMLLCSSFYLSQLEI